MSRLAHLLSLLRRAWAGLTDPGPAANDMDDMVDKTREHRKDAADATRRADGSLSRVRVILETVDDAAGVIERWRWK